MGGVKSENENWWIGPIHDAEHFEGHFHVIQGQMGKHGCMDMKLGGWGRIMMPVTLKVISRPLGSSKVKWVNIGAWT